MATLLKCLYSKPDISNSSGTPESFGPASGKAYIVSTIILTNKNTTTAANVTLALRNTDNTQWPLRTAAIAASSRTVVTDQITLSYVNATGYRLEVWADLSSAVDLVVSGMERDL